MTTERLAYFALLVFVMVIPWERNVAVPGLGAIGTPFGLIAAALAVLASVRNGRLILRQPSAFMAVMALFVLWSVVSYFWSVQPMSTLGRSVTYAQLFVMVWLIWQLCKTQQEHRALLQAYVVGGYVAVAGVLVAFVTGGWGEATTGFRLSFFGGNPNWLALAIALGIPMAWHLIITGSRQYLQVLNACFIALAVLAIALTGSRGGFITATVAMIVIPLTFWHLGLLRKLALLGLLGAGLYSAFIVLPEANMERLLTTREEVATGTLTGRTRIWSAGLDVVQSDPTVSLFGAGSGNFGAAIAASHGAASAAHNAYLSILVGNGLVGLTLFMGLLLLALAPVLALKSPLRQLYFALWLTLCVALFPANLETQKSVWFTLALLSTASAYVLGRASESGTSSRESTVRGVRA